MSVEHNFKWKNNGRTKVMIGCGTRPEIIRLAAVIKRCRDYFDCCVVYYNQNWDRNLSTVFWEDFELRNTFGEFGPDILVPVVGENLGVTCGNILGRSYELLSELQPDGYLVLGDTNSCLSAISDTLSKGFSSEMTVLVISEPACSTSMPIILLYSKTFKVFSFIYN